MTVQAIRTVLLPATRSRPTRVKATAEAGSITLAYYDPLVGRGIEAHHRCTAEMLVIDLGWSAPSYGTLVSGCLPDGSWCHVLTGRDGKGG
jgi:hypothetical protein